MASALDEVSTEYGLLAEAVSHPDDFFGAPIGCAPTPNGTTASRSRVEDVIFSLRGLQEESSAVVGLLPACRRRRRRPASATSPSPSISRRQPRTAADRRPAQRAAEALVGRHRQGRQQARHRRDHARAAARLRRLSREGVRGRPQHRLRARRRTIGARTSTSISAAIISTSCATNISATPPSRSKPSRPTRSTGAPRTARRTGRPPTTSRRCSDKRVILEEFPIRNSGGMQAFAFNIRRDKFKDPRVRRAFNYAFDFEEMNKQMFFGQYRRIDSYFEGTELASSGLPEGAELEILRNRARQGAAGGLHHALHQSGRRSRRGRCATTCAKRCGCCARPARRSATRSWSTPRPASR